jgi:hypothetical protein
LLLLLLLLLLLRSVMVRFACSQQHRGSTRYVCQNTFRLPTPLFPSLLPLLLLLLLLLLLTPSMLLLLLLKWRVHLAPLLLCCLPLFR